MTTHPWRPRLCPQSSPCVSGRISSGGRIRSWSTSLRPTWRLSGRRGGAVSPIVRVGHPRQLIVEVATSLKADLVILGSHSTRGLLDIVLGGTAQQVSEAAPCLVLLMSPQPEGGGQAPCV